MNTNDLLDEARRVRERAYAPYSQFAVGAAVLTRSGRVFTGCNIENLSFGLTICAERAAIFAAVAAGEREFAAIAMVADSATPVTPCGACRQVMAEFGDTLQIVSANLKDERFTSTIAEMLPRSREGILGT